MITTEFRHSSNDPKVTLECSTVLYNTVQYSTLQYCTVQYSTSQCSTGQCSTVQGSAVQYSTVQYSTVQCSTGDWPYSAVLFNSPCNHYLKVLLFLGVFDGYRLVSVILTPYFTLRKMVSVILLWYEKYLSLTYSFLFIVSFYPSLSTSFLHTFLTFIIVLYERTCFCLNRWKRRANGAPTHYLFLLRSEDCSSNASKR